MQPNLALVISFLSLAAAVFALGWNIYRDVILKPRVKVRFAVVTTVARGRNERNRYVSVRGTNFGPGEVVVQMIEGLDAPLWRRLVGRSQRFVVLPPDGNPISGKVPARLRVGDSVDLLLPYGPGCVLKDRFTHIGLTDSFGRDHWAPRKNIRAARELFARDHEKHPV